MCDFSRDSPAACGERSNRPCDPGEVQVDQLTLPSRREPLTPTLSPQERGEGDANYHFNSRPNVP